MSKLVHPWWIKDQVQPPFRSSVKTIDIPVGGAEVVALSGCPSPTGCHGTFVEQGSVQQRQESRLPEGVAAVHQLVAAALKASLEAHLPADHPALRAEQTHNTWWQMWFILPLLGAGFLFVRSLTWLLLLFSSLAIKQMGSDQKQEWGGGDCD